MPHRVLLLMASLMAVLAGCGVSSDGATSTTAPTSLATSTTAARPPTSSTSTTTITSTTVDARPQGPGGTIELDIATADGRTRTAHLYVPAGLRNAPAPLVVALHGGTGSGAQFERSAAFDALADRDGVIVAYPDGIGTGPDETALRTWNGGVCCGAAARTGVDDVAFVRALVAEVEARYVIDPDRVFATGHSNGMILAYRLACEAADLFAAVAGQAGTLGVDGCRPSRPLSFLHVHGEADVNVPIDGGRGQGIANVDFPSPRRSIATLAGADGCPAEPATAVDGKATTQTWAPCGEGTVVAFTTVADADHGWMGSTSPLHDPSLRPSRDFDTTAAVWAFFAAHPRGSS